MVVFGDDGDGLDWAVGRNPKWEGRKLTICITAYILARTTGRCRRMDEEEQKVNRE